jgi:hypothetical protein
LALGAAAWDRTTCCCVADTPHSRRMLFCARCEQTCMIGACLAERWHAVLRTLFSQRQRARLCVCVTVWGCTDAVRAFCGRLLAHTCSPQQQRQCSRAAVPAGACTLHAGHTPHPGAVGCACGRKGPGHGKVRTCVRTCNRARGMLIRTW